MFEKDMGIKIMINMIKLKMKYIFSSSKVQAYFVFAIILNAFLMLILTSSVELNELVDFHKYFFLYLGSDKGGAVPFFNSNFSAVTIILLLIIITSIMIANNREIKQLNKVLATRLRQGQIMMANIIVDIFIVVLLVSVFYMLNYFMLWFMIPDSGTVILGVDNSTGEYGLAIIILKIISISSIIYLVSSIAFVLRNNRYIKFVIGLILFMCLIHASFVYNNFIILTSDFTLGMCVSFMLIFLSISMIWIYDFIIKRVDKVGYYDYWDFRLK